MPWELFRSTLPNGLRVVIAPDDTESVVAVAVHYGVGVRSEPETHSGFAHLMEHLLAAGSESAPQGVYGRRVRSVGGLLSAETTPDYTVFGTVVPADALEMALFFEADRMRAPLLDEADLRTRIEEITAEVATRSTHPYGTFPNLLASVVYDTFPNVHDGWGDTTRLEQATPEECAGFFDTHYCPRNAVLTITGAVTIDQAEHLVGEHFTDIPDRALPPRPTLDEPVPAIARRRYLTDRQVPVMATAVGYRMPDPSRHLDDYLACLVLADVLTAGPRARLQQRLVHRDRLATQVVAGPLHGPFHTRHPDTLRIAVYAASAVTDEQILDMIEDQRSLLVRRAPAMEEVIRSITGRKASMYTLCGEPDERARALGRFELLYSQPELLRQILARVEAITPGDVTAAATSLRPANRGILTMIPAGTTVGATAGAIA